MKNIVKEFKLGELFCGQWRIGTGSNDSED